MVQFAEALQQLGFNFWQVFVCFVIFLFRKDIPNALISIGSFRLTKTRDVLELEFVKDTENVKRILDTFSLENSTVEEVRDELGLILKRRCVIALLDIRTFSGVLWEKLKNISADDRAVVVELDKVTFSEIERDLRLLDAAGMFEYSTLPLVRVEGMQKVRLGNIHGGFAQLIQESERF